MRKEDFADPEPGSRFWTYSRHQWDPRWRHKLGVPSLGGDEWGRRTIVVGLWFLGYVVWAWRTCRCPECDEVRDQSYRWSGGKSQDGDVNHLRECKHN